MEEISPHLTGVLLAYAAFLLGIASPGPNVLAVLGVSMAAGRSAGIALALGVATGSLTWAVLTAIGLSAVLAAYAGALLAIKIAGGLYLLWLAYKAFRSAASAHDIETQAPAGKTPSSLGYARRGYVVQMTNPKAALAWIAIISLGLSPGSPWWVAAAIVGGTFALSIMIHTLYAVVFSTPTMLRLYGKARRTIQATIGVFFAFAGVKLLTSRA